jgi:hypothetical protein
VPFFLPTLNTALFLMSGATDCYTVHTCICIVRNFLTVTNLVIVFKLKCVCIQYVSYSEFAENIFIMKSPLPCQTAKKGGISDLAEFLECYLLLYTTYSG